MKLISWNVNGIRAVIKKGFTEWIAKESPDVLCLQETKAEEDQVPMDIKMLAPYKTFWCSGVKKGYSGTATFTKTEPFSVKYGFGMAPEFDCEGRTIITEFKDFTLFNIYFPNGQKDDIRLKYKLAFYDATLEYCETLRRQGRELIICGDYNTAHNEIDLARPEDNTKVSGFLRIERDWMDKIEKLGYIDTFRHFNPDKPGAYTWWSMRTAARSRNVGWRLDYFYVTEKLAAKVKKAEILSDIEGSDHCPVSIEIEP